MSELKEITMWERYNGNAERWEHNHISDGFDPDLHEPKAVNKEQEKSWMGAEWQKFKAYLDGNKVIDPRKN
jgi:hypothetical protein